MKDRALFAAFAGAVLIAGLALGVTRWRSRGIQPSDPAWPKIEALTDAAKNGLITQHDYERKVTELVGGSERKAAAIRKASRAGNGVWTPADGQKISALTDALSSGAITEEQFDAKVAEFARERQAENASANGSR